MDTSSAEQRDQTERFEKDIGDTIDSICKEEIRFIVFEYIRGAAVDDAWMELCT
jgi:hypothetical protein